MRVSILGEIGRRSYAHHRVSLLNASRVYIDTHRKQVRWAHAQQNNVENLLQNLTDRSRTQLRLDDEFLRRASKYGIHSIQELDRQGRYINQEDRSQLVQTEPLRSDFNLWRLLLDYQTQYYGCEGVDSIYRLLKYQGPLVRLSAENEAASALWKQMLVVTAQDATSFNLFNQLCERHGVGWSRPKLFSEVVAILLASGRTDKAVWMCDKLREKRSYNLAVVIDLIHAFRPKRVEDFRRFFVIYQKLQPLEIYEEAMRELWQMGRHDEAVLLHKFLIASGDVPSSFDNIEPLMIHLAKSESDPEPILSQLSAAGVDYGHRAHSVYEAARQEWSTSRTTHVAIQSRQVHVKSNRVSDSFAAKAFATNALPFEFVLNSLKAFGLGEIGPQTVREIGLKAKDLVTLVDRLNMLNERGVDTGASVYVRTVRKLCQRGQAALLAEVLITDFHHDVFEDRHLQSHLLETNVRKCNWSKVNLLLTIWARGGLHGNDAGNATSALQFTPGRGNNEHRALLNFALKPNGSGAFSKAIGLRRTVKRMISLMRTQRQNGWTQYQQLQHARFLAGLMQEAVLAGESFGAFEWRHVLSRIGGQGKPDLAIGLIYWLVRLQHETRGGVGVMVPLSSDPRTRAPSHLSQRSANTESQESATLRPSERSPRFLVKGLVDSKLQQALMHWSLQYSLLEEIRRPRESWQNCLEMLHLLEQEYAIPIDLKALKRVIIMRCRYLRPKRYNPNSQIDVVSEQETTEQLSPEKRKEVNKVAWRVCSQLLGELHNIWSTSPEDRNADLNIAFETLFARRAAFTKPYSKRKGINNRDNTDQDYFQY